MIPSMPEVSINAEGGQKLLSNLQPNEASGPDDLPAHILKQHAAIIPPALACIVSTILIDSGILPEDWRRANTSPVFKTGDHIQASKNLLYP